MVVACVDSGKTRAEPFLVIGGDAVCAYMLMFSHRSANSSPPRMAVSSANWANGIIQGLHLCTGLSSSSSRASSSADNTLVRPCGVGGFRTIAHGFGSAVPILYAMGNDT
jgi:hypothetical protein